MYDIEELEKKWLKYRRRKLIIVTSSIVLAASVIGGVSYLVFNTESSNKPQEVNRIKKQHIPKDEDIVVNRKEKPLKSMNTEVPSMKKGENDTVSAGTPEINTPENNSPVESETKAVEHNPKLNMVISEPKSGSVIKEIEKRFSESKSYDDAIYLAEYYYGKNNFKKAEYWAMQANIVDSIPEESWIIFAKAKVKSGHRVEALKVLEAYYNKTGSTNALKLIDTIRKNKKF